MLLLLSGLAARARSLTRGIRRTADVDAEMEEEFRSHLELRAADMVRTGIPPAEAARRARLEFGSTEHYKDRGRASRGLRRFDDLRASWLDFKLGFRMLAKYPGLTLVGGLAMAFAIWIGAGTFEFVRKAAVRSLPVPGGDRIVGLQVRDVAAGRLERRASHDVALWRDALRSIRDLGAFRDVERNLIVGVGPGEPITIAEISASAFRLVRIPPLLGRVLVDADERPGAPSVLVIGHDVWQRRFGADPAVVGRTVRLGSTPTTVVGVMPEGFEFPVSHDYWAPLRLDALAHGRREGPAVRAFGRLAPGVSLDDARAELSALGTYMAAEFPDTHEHLRPQVVPYPRMIMDPSGKETLAIMSLNLPVAMLVILVCANVALLMFARAATREEEIIVRTALGASRGRIITQLFAEALVLGSLAAVVGLSAAAFGLRRLLEAIEWGFYGGVPFWIDASLSPATAGYAALLTLAGAAIAGVLPALKVTRGMGTRLRQVGSGGGGLRFGGIWTAVIVSQVALTVVFPAFAFVAGRQAAEIESVNDGIAAREYLTARLEMDREPAPAPVGSLPPVQRGDTTRSAVAARVQETRQRLKQRLAADPAVAGVSFATVLPRMDHGPIYIDVDEGGAAPLDPRWPFGHQARAASVDPDFFDTFRVPVLSGRGFRASDLGSASRVVIVNQSFVTLVLGDRNAIGRRIRYVDVEDWKAGQPPSEEASPWYEIVGVVRDLAMTVDGSKVAGLYHPIGDDLTATHVAVHVRGDPVAFAPRFRGIVTAVDPTLRLYEVVPLERVTDSSVRALDFTFRLLVVVSVIALTLSLAGIYAVMSFTVARRTREIGVRVALGASPGRVLGAVFRQPLKQIGLGVAAGAVVLAGLILLARDGVIYPTQILAVAGYATLMLAVSLLACAVPTWRALRVEPTEALRADSSAVLR